INGIRNLSEKVSTEKRDLFRQPLNPAELNRFQACVINPPRAGAKAQAEALAKSAVGVVAMVSCNPATWSRDARTLKNAGFSLASVDVIDQFVWSPHLEIVSVFTKK